MMNTRFRPPSPTINNERRIQYLRFTLGTEEYGLDILKVREIRGWESVRPLPDMPDYIKGVLELRDNIVPIMDLRVRFRSGLITYTPTTVMIVVTVESDGQTQALGLVVDSVSDVLEIPIERVRPTPKLGYRIHPKFIQGVMSEEAQLIVLLNVDYLLEPDELNQLTEFNPIEQAP